jgi:hypothetical protein
MYEVNGASRLPGKAVLAAQDRVIGPLVAAGVPVEELSAMTLGDAGPSTDRERLCDRRLDLGIPSADHDPLLVNPDGSMVGSGEVVLGQLVGGLG